MANIDRIFEDYVAKNTDPDYSHEDDSATEGASLPSYVTHPAPIPGLTWDSVTIK